jgi:hypothetical protein
LPVHSAAAGGAGAGAAVAADPGSAVLRLVGGGEVRVSDLVPGALEDAADLEVCVGRGWV